MRYWPVPSVTDERTFSISTGLDASTVTPGRIAPETSLTLPVIVDWAYARAGSRTMRASAPQSLFIPRLHTRSFLNLTENMRQSYVALDASQAIVCLLPHAPSV